VSSSELWRYTARLVPWALTATSVLLGVGWAVTTRLDAANERSVLAVISTLALCAVLDDDARAFTVATPVPRWQRNLPRVVVPATVLGVAWAATVALVTAAQTGPADPAPWWAMTLEWSTVAASQVAIATVAARRPGTTGSIGPGLLVALVWLATEGAPMLHRYYHPVRLHAAVWLALLSATLLVIALASRDRRFLTIRRSPTW